jgi:hypothetical protein
LPTPPALNQEDGFICAIRRQVAAFAEKVLNNIRLPQRVASEGLNENAITPETA